MRIYKITNLINGKNYIGQTIHSLEQRFRKHKNQTRGNMIIAVAIKKYGVENFRIEELEICESQSELNEAECKWIEFYQSQSPNGYNIRGGGGAHGKMAESSKAKLRGRKLRPETVEKMKKAHQNMSEETRRKMSKSGMGKKLSEKAKANLAFYRELNRWKPRKCRRGEEHQNTTLTNSEVLRMRKLNKNQNISGYKLAKMFSVSHSTACRIIRRESWKHI
jgi:group I intron endonuclease